VLGVLLVLLGVVAVGWCVAVGRVDRTSSVGPLLLWIKLKAMVVVVVASLCRRYRCGACSILLVVTHFSYVSPDTSYRGCLLGGWIIFWFR
jgi:hypothetical protein